MWPATRPTAGMTLLYPTTSKASGSCCASTSPHWFAALGSRKPPRPCCWPRIRPRKPKRSAAVTKPHKVQQQFRLPIGAKRRDSDDCQGEQTNRPQDTPRPSGHHRGLILAAENFVVCVHSHILGKLIRQVKPACAIAQYRMNA